MTVQRDKTIVSDAAFPRFSKTVSHAAVWDILELFIRELEYCPTTTAQIERVLLAIRDSIHADAVFKVSSLPGVPVEVVADRPLPADWCRAFAQLQLESMPLQRGSHCGFSTASACALAPDLKPQSTLMIRLSKSRSLWIVAVSFNPQRLFRVDDLKIMGLIRRIFLDQRRQALARDKLTDALLGVVRGLNEAISAKSPFTCGHSERVARMAVCLGRQMNLAPAVLSDLHLGGLLHDVGKIGIRDSVLQKQGALNEEEFAHMRQHPVIGDTIVSKIKPLAHLCPGVRHHHERYDGTGYPDRLAGDAIPVVARILGVVDACDAMMSPRPYRPGLPTTQVDHNMTAGAGTQWDPQLIAHFMVCRRELYSIYEKGIGDSILQAVEAVVRAGQED